MLLWEEYCDASSDSFSYSWFCERYKEWAGRLKPTLRRVHVAGEKLFVDYSGHMMEVVDGLSGIRAGSITSSCAFHSSAMRSASAHAGAASRRRAGMRTCLPSNSKGNPPFAEASRACPRTLARRLGRSELQIDEYLFRNITHTFSIVAERR
jgi:hypothetical protein